MKPPVDIEAEILPATADGVKLEKIPKADEVLKDTVMPEFTPAQKLFLKFISLLDRTSGNGSF